MKKLNITKENKIYFLAGAGAIVYAITSSLTGVVFNILKITENIMPMCTVVYQILCIALGLLYFALQIKHDPEDIKKTLKNHLKGILSITTYLVLSTYTDLPLRLLRINPQHLTTAAKVIYLLGYETIMLLILIMINKTKIKKDIVDIKKNHKKYYKENLKYWLLALSIMFITNFIITVTFQSNLSNNETIIREQFQISPLYIYISAVILGPFIEEIVFRQSFRNLIKNDTIFIIISGLVFGMMHAFNTETITLVDILYIIPYSVPGMAFAKMLSKTDNIFTSTGIHLLHNGLMIAMQFVMYFYL